MCQQSTQDHDDVIKWKHFPRYWPFVWGIHRLTVTSPHKGQWRGILMLSLICARINRWVNNREAGDLRRRRAHYDVIALAHHDSLSLKHATITLHTYAFSDHLICICFSPLWKHCFLMRLKWVPHCNFHTIIMYYYQLKPPLHRGCLKMTEIFYVVIVCEATSFVSDVNVMRGSIYAVS